MERFSEEEMELLSRYCTNIDGNIFALINLPQTVCGALFSRYSRSPKSLRRVLLEEFIQKPESEFKEIVGDVNATDNQIIATKKAEEFYERVLVGYGDDSVAELGGAHIACENISNIATKFLQDSRIGISPLEKSTRYVYFDHKDENGQYGFYRDKKIMESRFADEYVQVCNNLFELYSSLIEPMSKYIMEKHPPPEGLSERAYASTVRAKVCDVLRGILPASTLTNVGLYGNGRAFEYLLTKAYSSPLGEIREIGAKMYEELRKVIPSFVKRATDKYGVAYQEYLKESANDTAKEVLSLLKRYEGKFGSEAEKDDVVLVDYDRDAEDKIITAIIFPHANSGLDRIMEKVKKLSPDEKRRIIEAYVGKRKNRRHKPGRAFEHVYYTFSLLGNFGMYRDLHRHRILTQERQLLTTKHGFDMPPEIVEIGREKEVSEAIGLASELFEKMEKSNPLEAQYVVPLGCRVRWYIKMNLREAFHFVELRSMMQGHRDYRRVAQKIYLKIGEVHPYLASYMRFVDMEEHPLERLEAEKRIDKKMEKLKGN